MDSTRLMVVSCKGYRQSCLKLKIQQVKQRAKYNVQWGTEKEVISSVFEGQEVGTGLLREEKLEQRLGTEITHAPN